MSLDRRSTAILSHLVNAKTYVPIKELEEKFKISRRTIYYDIEKINGWLQENRLSPVSQVRGAGFILEEETARRIPDTIELFQAWHYEYSAKERKAWLALYLLGGDTPLFLEDLMEKVRVSRNTTIEDLKVLKEEIERFNLSLEFERKSGYTVMGSEDNKRKAIVFYLSTVLPIEGWQTLLSKIPLLLNSSTSSNEESNVDLFNHEELKAVQKIVAESEEELAIKFTDDFFYSLTLRLMFFGKRLTQGKNVTIDKVEKEILLETKEYRAALSIADKLSNLFQVDFPQDEIFYITKHLLSSKVQSTNSISQEDVTIEAQELSQVVSNMVTDFQKYACVFISDRELLEKNLLLHVKPSFYRIKYDLEVENQVSDLIKEKYSDIFQITKKVIHHLEDAVGKQVNEDEIALIAMHFGGWMRRTGLTPANRKKVLIVCASGIGTSKLLEHQLEGLFSTIDIVGSASSREYENNDFDVDFIISTIPLPKANIPVFIVSPILTEAEKESLLKKVNALLETESKPKHSVDVLMDIIGKNATIHNEETLKKELRLIFSKNKTVLFEQNKPSLRDLLTREYIQVRKEVNGWKEAIRIAAEPLLANKVVTDHYVSSMIQLISELGPYIVVSPKVAIPHAKPEDGVNKLGMSLLCLENSVQFSESSRHAVQLIIILAAIDEETHLKALSELTTLFSKKDTIEKVILHPSVDNIVGIIETHCN